MVHRFFSFVTLLFLFFAVEQVAADRLKVATTFTVIADMTRNVAGNAADVVSITKPGAEIHNYQPTPRDLLRVRDADLVLWNGLGLERWFVKFMQRLKSAEEVVISEGVTEIPIIHGPYRNKPNPHAWMSPQAALIYIGNIRDALVAADPANSELYDANAKAYAQQVTDLVEPLKEQLESVPAGQRWLASSEGAFSYLARDFGLDEIYLWPINADSQGAPQQVRRMIDAVREHGIKAVFSESTVSDKAARQVARETGARYGGVLYVDSLSASDGPVPTYLELLRLTTETIVKGLTAAGQSDE
ncbi:iron ABC transporter substrate-binding protein [Chromatiales bacterium (ex Bugula neritina AB1)]|nr:iron ABC transporter substrate-binding protein [Chromatiales bacterium (ex Bugula neritina AB1)]